MAGGVLFGLIAGFWTKIKALLWRAVSVLVQHIEIPSESAHNAVISHLVKNFKISRYYDHMYGAMYEHTRDGNFGPFLTNSLVHALSFSGRAGFRSSSTTKSNARAEPAKVTLATPAALAAMRRRSTPRSPLFVARSTWKRSSVKLVLR
jgi:hypothetical protein